MGYRYGILGAGRQGAAAAYDLVRYGDAESVRLVDANLSVAEQSADRINTLTGRDLVAASAIDARDPGPFFRGIDVALSAVPYYLNPKLARAAIQSGVHFCDLGGNTEIVLDELSLDAQAREAGIALVPDCGVGPGMIANLGVYAIESLDEAVDVCIYDGGIPQNPKPPFNYRLFFNLEGLTNEYWGDALFLKDGRIERVPSFSEAENELLDIPGVGNLEAFVTAGGLSTMSSTYAGRLRTLKNKVLRYPGHAALMKGLTDLGFLDLEPIAVGDHTIVPRDVLHALLGPRIAPEPDDRDQMIIYVRATGTKDGRDAVVTVQMVDLFDEATGFSAMERTTGFHLAIVAAMLARGDIEAGARPVEIAVPAATLVHELGRRNMTVHRTVERDGEGHTSR